MYIHNASVLESILHGNKILTCELLLYSILCIAMNLYISTYLLAGISAVLFFIFAISTKQCEKMMMSFLRSTKAAVVFFGGSGAWFIYQLSQLGEADFGQIKVYLMAIFGLAGILAFFYLNDFLSVRGVCVLALLLARQFLDSAFLQEPVSRLVLVTQTYIWIVIALYLGAIPYRLRDFFNYIYQQPKRAKILGYIFGVCSLSLIISTLFY